ncbi:MAG: hypothetical protein ACR2NH_10270, partial [Solirubrobacteraceae bacterium]
GHYTRRAPMTGPRKILLAALAGATFLGACANNDDPLSKADLVKQADVICADAGEQFAALGPTGVGPPGVAADYAAANRVQVDRLGKLRDLEPADDVKGTWNSFIAAEAALVKANQAIVPAARSGDPAKVEQANRAANAAFAERAPLVKKTGLRVCGNPPRVEVKPTGTPAPAGAPKPASDTAKAAGARWIAAINAADCAALNRINHSDNDPFPATVCRQITTNLKGITVKGTQDAGPVAIVELDAPKYGAITAYFVLDRDGTYHYAGDKGTSYGGLRPAPEGGDAEEKAAAILSAIRNNDPKAFNATVSIEALPAEQLRQQGKFDSIGRASSSGKAFVAAIRADPDAKPVLVHANAVQSVFLLDLSGKPWLLNLYREPGAGAAYAFGGWFPVGPTAASV